jgi:hypothetical protein
VPVVLFVGAERQGCETNHPPAVIKNEGNGNSTPFYTKSKQKLNVTFDNVTSGFMIDKQGPLET